MRAATLQDGNDVPGRPGRNDCANHAAPVTTDGHALLKGGSLPVIAPDLLGEIVSTAADLTLIVSPAGTVQSVLVNAHHRSFGSLAHWEGKPLAGILTSESASKLAERMREVQGGSAGSRPIELNHADAEDRTVWDFPIRYTLHRVDAAGTVLMLGRDLRPIAEMQQQLVKAQLALERDYEAQREFDTRYRVLMETTRDAIVIVSMSTGRIADLNAVAVACLGGTRQDLVGAAIAQEFEGRRRGEFLESMSNLAVADSIAPIELQARRSHRRVLIVPSVFRAAGERLLLCRLEPVGSTDAVPDELAGMLVDLYRQGVEGVVFTDRDGLIRGANEAFLNLADVADLASIKGRTLSDFLSRGAVDLKVMLDNARRSGHMRLYATKVTTAYDGEVAVEISVTWLGDRLTPIVVFVVRDASRAEALRRTSGLGDEGMRNVAELVGASSLKDIVAETTDVVERMCIETAVELTRNNRVAAAEMLGLSRQSLYVKLRKYGLLNKNGD
jgi:transcriptional regulator PpsR